MLVAMRPLIFLLPVVALLIAGGAVLATVALQDDADPAPAGTQDTSATAIPTETPPSTRPQLEPQQSVCQGVLHVPEAGAQRDFPDEYTQQREVLGFMIVAGPGVPVEALDVAAATIEDVFADPELAAPLVEKGAYI